MTKILTWTVEDAGPYNLRRALGETNFKMLSSKKAKSKIRDREYRIGSLLLEEKVARETSRMRCSRRRRRFFRMFAPHIPYASS